MADTRHLKQWQSHKRVHADKIVEIDGMKLRLQCGDRVDMAPAMISRYTPILGDYYIIFADGFASIMACQQFEEGYHPL